MACQTQYLLNGHYNPVSAPALFLFFGTLFIYSLHRLYSLSKTTPEFAHPYRKFVWLLWINTIVGAVMSAVCWLQLPEAVRWQTLAPCILSLAYILPVLPGGRRLREVATLKIFLIAFCWSWLTVVAPTIADGMGWSAVTLAMAIERAAFIFAIGIGFDLRDRLHDKAVGVATLPVLLGARGAMWCAAFGLFIACAIAGVLTATSIYPGGAFLSILFSGLLALLLIARSGKKNLPPLYFLFGLDGLMILQFLLILI